MCLSKLFKVSLQTNLIFRKCAIIANSSNPHLNLIKQHQRNKSNFNAHFSDPFTVKSPKEFFSAKEKNVAEYILNRSREQAEKGKTKWITDTKTGFTINFDQIESISRRIASALYKRGVRNGDTIVYSTNDVSKIYIFAIGVWRANAVLRSSYVEDNIEVLVERVLESKAKLVLLDSSLAENANLAFKSDIPWNVEVFYTGIKNQINLPPDCLHVDELFHDDGTCCPDLERSEEDLALSLCTSGTTGKSKGSLHSHSNCINSMRYLGLTSKICPNFGPHLLMWKATHVIGFHYPFGIISHGNWGLLMKDIEPVNVLKAINKYSPVYITGAPKTILWAAQNTDPNYYLSSVKYVMSGGANVSAAFEMEVRKFPNLISIIKGYGLTECPMVLGTRDFSDGNEIFPYPNLPLGTVGKPLPGSEVRIVDVTTKEPLKIGEKGEIAVKSPVGFKGYSNNQNAAKDIFTKDGFILTGDLGYIDKNGFVFVVERIKDVFKYLNNHVSPTEIEEVIKSHDAVLESVVFGIPHENGEDFIPRALIVLKPNAKNTDPEQIKIFVNERLPEYMHIRGGVFIVKQIPMGKTGKILRNAASEIKLSEMKSN